jgi:putative ABC transport system permease protein
MSLYADFRVATRGLLRSKGFACSAAITLALGIAATTTIFSVVYGVLLRPLPYRDADRLVVIQGEKDFSTGPRLMNYSGPELEDFAGAAQAFSPLAMAAASSFTTRTDGGIESIGGATVSGAFFDVLGTPPQLGRLLPDAAEPQIVISDRLWRRLYGAAPDVLGRPLTLADLSNVPVAYTIVGVMPREFQYPSARADVWRPLAFVRTQGRNFATNRNGGGFLFVGRMRDGVTLGDARRDAARANDVLKPHFNGGRTDMHSKVVPLEEFITGNIGPSLWILLGAVALVLLVACANVANLMLARQASRSREIAMRMALGAPRARLVAYAIIESALVTAIGTAAGVAIAAGAIRLLQWIQPSQLPRLDAIAIDLPVLAFAIAVAALAAIGAALAPAVIATQTDAVLAFRAGRRSVGASQTRWFRSSLVVGEIAVSFALLVDAALLGRSLLALVETDLGVNTERVIAAQLDLGLGRSLSPERQAAMADALLQGVAAIPTVRAAGFGSAVPPTGEFQRASFVLSNAADTETVSHIVTMVPVSPGYFTTLQIPLLKGRYFDAGDSADVAKVMSVIVSRETAKRFFGNDDPIGRTLPMGEGQLTVVGVVEDVKYSGVANRAEPVMYRPFSQSPFRLVVLFARTTGDPGAIATELREVIQTYDRDINISSVQPLTIWLSNAIAQPRFRALLMATIAVVTLLLAMVGLYGVIAYSTSQRTSEIGLRVAVGAERSDVMRLVLLEGARLAFAGIVLGIAAAYASTRVLSTFLYQVTATDLTAFATSSAALFIVALLATYLPARRAAGVDPMTALRAE